MIMHDIFGDGEILGMVVTGLIIIIPILLIVWYDKWKIKRKAKEEKNKHIREICGRALKICEDIKTQLAIKDQLASGERFNSNLFPLRQFRFLEPGEMIQVGDLVCRYDGKIDHMVVEGDAVMKYDSGLLPILRLRK